MKISYKNWKELPTGPKKLEYGELFKQSDKLNKKTGDVTLWKIIKVSGDKKNFESMPITAKITDNLKDIDELDDI